MKRVAGKSEREKVIGDNGVDARENLKGQRLSDSEILKLWLKVNASTRPREGGALLERWGKVLPS